jgi:hypothetical protein
MTPMIEAMTLREHARVLRTLASVEDHPLIKNDLFKLGHELTNAGSPVRTSGVSREAGVARRAPTLRTLAFVPRMRSCCHNNVRLRSAFNR